MYGCVRQPLSATGPVSTLRERSGNLGTLTNPSTFPMTLEPLRRSSGTGPQEKDAGIATGPLPERKTGGEAQQANAP